MNSTKSPKFAPLDPRATFSAPYLDEYPDIDLVQPDPVEMKSEGPAKKTKTTPSPPGHRRHTVTH